MSLLCPRRSRALSLLLGTFFAAAMIGAQNAECQEQPAEVSSADEQEANRIKKRMGIEELIWQSGDESKSLAEQLSLKQSAEEEARAAKDAFAIFSTQMLQLGSLCRMRQFREAETLLAELRKSPYAKTVRNQIQFAFFDGTLKLNQGQIVEAIDVFRSVKGHGDKYPVLSSTIHQMLGAAFQRLGMQDEAVAACQQALVIAEASGSIQIEQGSRFALAGLYLQQNRIEEAERALANCPPVLESSSNFLYVHTLRWDIQMRAEDYEAAHKVVDRLFEHLTDRNAAPHQIGYIHSLRARCLVKEHSWEAAEDHILKAIAALAGTTKLFDAQAVHADILLHTDRELEGLAILQGTLEQPLKTHLQTQVLDKLISGYQKLGDFEMALKFLQQQLEIREQTEIWREQVAGAYFLPRAEQERLERVAQQHWSEASLARDQLRASKRSAVASRVVQNVSVAAALMLVIGGVLYFRSLNRARSAQVEEEQNQDKLSRQEQLESHLRYKSIGKLTGSVAHDLNNVLQIISQSYELLQLNGIENPTEEQQRWIQSSLESVAIGSRITSQLLAYARQEEIRPEIQPVRDLFESFWMLFDSVGGERVGLSIDFDIDQPDVAICVDPIQFSHAMLNLLLNASEAQGETGEIAIEVVSTDRPSLGESNHGDETLRFVCVTVADSGVGMDEATCQGAAESFFTTKPASAGVGLGLTFVQNFVEQSGGWLSLKSQVGRGTRASMFFPQTVPSVVNET